MSTRDSGKASAVQVILALVVVAAGVVLYGCKGGVTETRYENVLINGTGTMDVDTGTLKPEEGKDLFWRQRSATERLLEPKNGAAFANLGKVDFEKLTLQDLKNAEYSTEPIQGDDDDNKLTPGTVIAIKTDQGNYAKMIVTKNISMESTSRGEKRLYKFYDMEATFVVYKVKK